MKMKRIHLSISEQQEKILDKIQKATGITRSEIFRFLLFWLYIRKGDFDLPTRKQFQEFVYEIRKIGININQIAKKMNRDELVELDEIKKELQKFLQVLRYF